MKNWSSLPDLTASAHDSAQHSARPSLQRSLSAQSLDDALNQQARNALSFNLGAKLGSGSTCTTYECQVDSQGGISQLVLFRSPTSSAEQRQGLDHMKVLAALQLPSDYSGQLDQRRLKSVMDYCDPTSFEDFFPGASTNDSYKNVPHILAESSIYGAVDGKIGVFIRKAEGYTPLQQFHKAAFTGDENHSAMVKNLGSLMQDFSNSWRAMFLNKIAHTDAQGPNFGCTGLVSMDQTSPTPRLAIIDVGSFEPCDDDLWNDYFSEAIKNTLMFNFYALSNYETATPKTAQLSVFYAGKADELLSLCFANADYTPPQFLDKFDLFTRNFKADFDKLNQSLT